MDERQSLPHRNIHRVSEGGCNSAYCTRMVLLATNSREKRHSMVPSNGLRSDHRPSFNYSLINTRTLLTVHKPEIGVPHPRGPHRQVFVCGVDLSFAWVGRLALRPAPSTDSPPPLSKNKARCEAASNRGCSTLLMFLFLLPKWDRLEAATTESCRLQMFTKE